MNNDVNSSVADAAQNVTQQTSRIVDDVSTWISGNIVEIAIAAAFGVLIALVLLGLKAFGARLIRGRTSEDLVNWRVVFGRVLSKTSFFFIIMCSADLVAEHANTPPALLRIINILFVISAAFQAAIWARELILGFIQHRAGDTEDHANLGSALGIIRLLVSVALFAIATVVILDNVGVNVTGLIAGLGIGGIAIGLAAQGIFSDLFAALSILFDRPFRRGDSVRWDATSGAVEQIGLKSTRVRALTGEEVVISNANLLNKELHNLARLDRRRIIQLFGIIYQTPPETCQHIPELVRELVEGCQDCTLVRCGMIGFGASSLDFELQFDVHSEDWDSVFKARNDVLIAMLRKFNELGIEFVYPTQTSFTAAPDGTLVMPYAEVRMLAEKDVSGIQEEKQKS